MEIPAKILLYDNGSYEIMVEEAKDFFIGVEPSDLQKMAMAFSARKKKLSEEVETSKTLSKKARVKDFLKRVIKQREEKKRPLEERYEEAKAKARSMESDLGRGAGKEYLLEWEIEHKDELDAYIKNLQSKVSDELKFHHDTYVFAFKDEAGGISGADGLLGLVDTYVKKEKKRWQDLPLSRREKIAREILKVLFPTATRFEALPVSALANPKQSDGGIEIRQEGKTIKGKLRYDNIYGKLIERNRPYLEKATKIILK